MKIVESPALTNVLPPNATIQDRIDLLEEQNDELKQQKICYDGMIRVREKTIKELEKLKKAKTQSVQRTLIEGLLGPRPRGGLERRSKSKKKTKRKLKHIIKTYKNLKHIKPKKKKSKRKRR